MMKVVCEGIPDVQFVNQSLCRTSRKGHKVAISREKIIGPLLLGPPTVLRSPKNDVRPLVGFRGNSVFLDLAGFQGNQGQGMERLRLDRLACSPVAACFARPSEESRNGVETAALCSTS